MAISFNETASVLTQKSTAPSLSVISSSATAEVECIISFKCWSCHAGCTLDLREVQKDRLSIRLNEVKASDLKEKKYFVKCSSCSKFNTVKG